MINNTIHGCASEIRRELAGRKSGYKIALEHLAMRLLVEAFRSWPRPQIRQIAANFTQRLSQRDFFRAYDFMRRCRKELFRLQHLCGILGISEERFTRLFLASTNNTPANFYNRMLLERGLDLLGDSALSIKEISFELGFKTTSHFIASFRREFSTTPQEYRHSHSVGLINLEIAQFAPPLLENNRSRFVSA
jgi:transcriptional regulator GlxA family with amidase domain